MVIHVEATAELAKEAQNRFYQAKGVEPLIKKLVPGDGSKVYEVTVSGEEYDLCEEASHNMWTKEKPSSTYNDGLLNTEDDPRRTERIGRLGEMAFAKLFDLPINLNYIKGGDESDFATPLQELIDVKTSHKRPWHSDGLILGETSFGNAVKLKSNIYVFAFIEEEDKENKTAKMCFVGWRTRADILKTPLKRAKVKSSKHRNYEVSYYEMDSMLLLDEIILGMGTTLDG